MSRMSSTVSMVAGAALTAVVAASSTGVARLDSAQPAPRTVAHVAAQQPDQPDPPEPAQEDRWIHTWTAMPQLCEPNNMPPAPFTQGGRVLANATLRQTIRVTLGGQRFRLRINNVFGGAVLPVTGVSIAKPAGGAAGVSAIEPGTAVPLTFDGQPSVDVPVGQEGVSDPVDIDVAPGSNLTVTMFLAQGQASNNITSHPGSRTASYLLSGNHLTDADLPGSTRTEHWYFIGGLEVSADENAAGVAILGDSLTDGRGSTTNGNNRWPDLLFNRLQEQPETADVAVLNQAAGGNCVLSACLGPSAVSRFDRDILGTSGVKWVIIFEGINDIGGGGGQAQQIIAAFQQFIDKAHAKGMKVYGGTLTPVGGSQYAAGEGARTQINNWIRTSGAFDAVIDFAAATGAPGNPNQLAPQYDSGDRLHLSPAGYQAMADAIPTELFLE